MRETGQREGKNRRKEVESKDDVNKGMEEAGILIT